MAGQAIGRHGPPFLVLTAVSALLLVLLQTPLATLDDSLSAMHYRIRGMEPADSNIVLVYIDDEALRSVGWPVKRNFHALMIRVLTELDARTVGVEVVFEEERLGYPEYDDLLTAVTRTAGNVVLPLYFDTVEEGRGIATGPHEPFPRLRDAAAGLGHVHYTGDGDVPILLQSEEDRRPALGLALLSTFLDGDLRVNGESFAVESRGDLREFSAPGGLVSLNYPGGLAAYRRYPFIEVLRSYDAMQMDRPGLVPLSSFRDKIVLVCVIAEGRSQFLNTPVDPRLPSVALHAAFLDNALRDRFLVHPDAWLVTILAILFAGACSAAAVGLRRPYAVLVPLCGLAAVSGISLFLFVQSSLLLPIAPFLLGTVVSVAAGSIYRQRSQRKKVEKLETEKKSILSRLGEREAKVETLERELAHQEAAHKGERTKELLDEILRYRTEIRELSARAEDMVPFSTGDGEDQGPASLFEGIVHASGGKMKDIVSFVQKIAGSNAPVLVLGESGTGKELVARAIHARSGRAGKAFVAVNCGALTESLLESELFGHEKGAFTGAVKERLGRFELAHGGTIFLDEIGETSENFQVKLLRVLQEGELERVGGTGTLKVDVRVIAASNKNLKEEVRSGRFREDLYYRLNVLTVMLPTLGERQADIPFLVQHFLVAQGGGLQLSRSVVEALEKHPWPGNIRELESTITRAVLLAKADGRGLISLKDLPEDIASAGAGAVPLEEQVLEHLRAKGFSRSSVSETAEELGGLNRGTVAEYFRGEGLKTFTEHRFDVEEAIRALSGSADPDVNARVRKKLLEYLSNLVEAVDRARTWEECLPALRPKMKNLPQRYHTFCERVAEAYYSGAWTIE
jgi:DNA-binding NtrC family response regulator/CHASE2 domain-containing sensor protein